MSTLRKDPPSVLRNATEKPKNENSNPNVTTPGLKPSSSPSIRGGKGTHKYVAKMQSFVSPNKMIRERKFIVVKKNKPEKVESSVDCKGNVKVNGKCHCVEFENLRVLQNEFKSNDIDPVSDNGESRSGFGKNVEKSKEEAIASVPEPSLGRVTKLVKAFERMSTMPKESEHKDEEKMGEDTKKGIKWALSGLQKTPLRAPESQGWPSAFCPGEYLFTAESLGLDAHVSSSLDSSKGSVSSERSVGSRRSRRSGSYSSGTVRKWKKQQRQKQKQRQNQQQQQQQQLQRVTPLRPFNLRTEQRGKAKEQEFVKKLQEMIVEEEKQRIPIAQGLPWTIDEPECLVKPPVKEVTRPIDLKLHSDVRAVERAEFNYQMAEKITLIEQYKMERERQQKLQEEEETRRLRKELVPKAQPMPFFDKPFIPRRSVK